MSRALDDRSRILTALEAAGVRAATTGRLAAPCVLVEPGDPWSEPRRLPGRATRWRLTALAGKPDAAGALGELGELVDRVDTALRTVAGCELPSWAKPLDNAIESYAGTIATVQIQTL